MNLKLVAAVGLSLSMFTVGCEKKETKKPNAVATINSPMAEKEAVKAASTVGKTSDATDTVVTVKPAAEGVGSIKGKIVFIGKAPAPRLIDTSACHAATKVFEEAIVVNPNGTLKNVVVYLKDPGIDSPPFTEVVEVNQIDCQYVPHLIATVAGQKINIRSSDPLMHNVHTLGAINKQENFSMPAPGLRTLNTPSAEFLRIKCDVHPWMYCYVAIMEHSFFSVSKDAGEFEIKNVPAGTYNLTTWHERFEPMTKSVTVTAGQATDLDFEVKAP